MAFQMAVLAGNAGAHIRVRSQLVEPCMRQESALLGGDDQPSAFKSRGQRRAFALR